MDANRSILVLVPTELERSLLCAGPLRQDPRMELVCCGFGPLSSAIGTMSLLAQGDPQEVYLVGLAGVYERPDLVGQVMAPRRVIQEGIGIEEQGEWRDGYQLGLDRSIPTMLENLTVPGPRASCDLLLTVCHPSANLDEARQRYDRCRGGISSSVILEDMEGYAVAAACARFGRTLTILRAISNLAGCRAKSDWQIPRAIEALRETLAQIP